MPYKIYQIGEKWAVSNGHTWEYADRATQAEEEDLLQKVVDGKLPRSRGRMLIYTGSHPWLRDFAHFEEDESPLYTGVRHTGERVLLDGTQTHEVYKNHEVER